MANRAAFTITGTASSPPGYDAVTDETLTLQLEVLPATDVNRTQFEVGRSSASAPELLFPISEGPIQIADTPSSSVDIVLPTVAGGDSHSYELICRVVTDQAEYTFSRVVSIRNSSGLRKWIESERAEYYEEGWTPDQNEMVDVIQAGGGGGGGGESLAATLAIGNTTGALPILVDNSQYIRLGATNPAGTGLLRGRNNQGGLRFRNVGNTADIGVDLDADDVLHVGITGGAEASEVRLRAATSLSGYIGSTALYTATKPSGTTARFAFNPVGLTGGAIVTVEDSGAATPGRKLVLKGGTATAASQAGGDAALQPGAPGAGGAKGSVGIWDTAGAWRIQLDPSNELFYNSQTVHTFKVNGASAVLLGILGGFAVVTADGDASSGLLIAPSAPTTGVGGRIVAIKGGTGGTGDQDGGEAYLQAGEATGAGVDGSTGFKDIDDNWRIEVRGTNEIFYNAETTHQFQADGDRLFDARLFGTFAAVFFDGDIAPDGVLIGPDAPTTGVDGRRLVIGGGAGGTGNRNGGGAYFACGAHSGTGTSDGSCGVLSADLATTLFKVDPTGYAELGNASATPAAPAAGFRIFGAAGAAKVRSSSGTITTFGPAEPHCPRCKRDASKEWENPRSGWKVSICIWCATGPGGPLEGCVIERTQK